MGRSVLAIAPFIPRHYVVMEVKENLVAADRKATLKRFNHPHFKRIAKVVMGEPSSDYKQKVHAELLAEKQHWADVEWKRKKDEQNWKREVAKKKAEEEEKRKARIEEAKKRKEEVDAKRKELEAKRKEAADAKKAEEEAKKKEAEGENKEEKKDVEMKDESSK